MKILHVTSDWKWTGPAEPMLRLARAQLEAGHELALACPEPPDCGRRCLAGEARDAGLAPALALSGVQGALGLGAGSDVKALRSLVAEREIEVLHTWHTLDHVLALRALGAGSGRRAALVRSWRNAESPSRAPWSRWLFGPGTDGLLCVSPEAARRVAVLRGTAQVAQKPPARTAVVTKTSPRQAASAI